MHSASPQYKHTKDSISYKKIHKMKGDAAIANNQ